MTVPRGAIKGAPSGGALEASAESRRQYPLTATGAFSAEAAWQGGSLAAWPRAKPRRRSATTLSTATE